MFDGGGIYRYGNRPTYISTEHRQDSWFPSMLHVLPRHVEWKQL